MLVLNLVGARAGMQKSRTWPRRDRVALVGPDQRPSNCPFAIIFFWFEIHTASTPIKSGMHTDAGAVIRKPGSAWLEGIPAISITSMFCFIFGCFEVDNCIRRCTKQTMNRTKHT